MLSHGLDPSSSTALSVEFGDSDSTSRVLSRHGVRDLRSLIGRAPPGMYDPDMSIYCLQIGSALIKRANERAKAGESALKPQLFYLSTTDYVQHKYAPGSVEANDFYAKVDQIIGQLDEQGAIVGLTAGPCFCIAYPYPLSM